MKFLVYPSGLLQTLSRDSVAWLRTSDGGITGVELLIEDNMIHVPSETIDFANFNISCPINGFGRALLTTSYLQAKEDPYILSLEMARGKISELRNHLQEWLTSENQIPEEFHQIHHESYQLFTQAVFHQDQPEKASELAWKSLEKAFEASEYLCQFHVNDQLVNHEKERSEYKHFGTRIHTSDAIRGNIPLLKESFSRICFPVSWNRIEQTQGDPDWDHFDAVVETCLSNSILCYSEPLIDFTPDHFPSWLMDWQHDFESFVSILCDYVESVICRYSDRIRVWNIARGFFSGVFHQLTQREVLTGVAHSINTARQIQNNLLLGISVTHPWGMVNHLNHQDLSPLHAVDLLQRTGVGLSWVSLEIPMGYQDKDYVPYDLMKLSELIDQWSVIELPLDLVLAFPSSDGEGDQQKFRIAPDSWKEKNSEKTQQRWMEYYMPMLIQKKNVMSVTWAELSDHPEMQFPESGLIRSDGSEKQSFSTLTQFRKQYGPPF